MEEQSVGQESLVQSDQRAGLKSALKAPAASPPAVGQTQSRREPQRRAVFSFSEVRVRSRSTQFSADSEALVCSTSRATRVSLSPVQFQGEGLVLNFGDLPLDFVSPAAARFRDTGHVEAASDTSTAEGRSAATSAQRIRASRLRRTEAEVSVPASSCASHPHGCALLMHSARLLFTLP